MRVRLPKKFVRFLFRMLFTCFYRIRVHGAERWPKEGGGIIVANHISWLDGVLLHIVCPRPIRVVVYEGNFPGKLGAWWADEWGAIMVGPGPKSIVRALTTARKAVQNGDLVCIFPEGGISRNGNVQGFKPGLMRILKGSDVPVVPLYIDELWGSLFTFSGGRFFTKRPGRWRHPISIHVGESIKDIKDVHVARQAVQQLGAEALDKRQRRLNLTRIALSMCKKRRRTRKIADSSGNEASGSNILLRSLILRRLLRRGILADSEQNVGVLLPPSVGGVLANFALALDRRVAVNLNYSVTSEVLNQCIAKAGIKHVLTSRQVMNKLGLSLDAQVIQLEDFKNKVTLGDKIAGAIGAFVTPAWLLYRQLGLHKGKGSDTLTIIFTSGSTGTPKGVVLSQDNIAHNVMAIDQMAHLTSSDVIVGILPFFHSFGYTVTLWAPLSLDLEAAYHFSPIDGKRVGRLIEKYKATVLFATPTFLRSYLKRCTKEQFASLDAVVAGAEKLPPLLSDAFEEKFGVRPVEGYGCTELAPLAAVNIPPSRSTDNFQPDRKEGTVGRLVPGVAARVVDLDSGEELPAGEAGMLLIKGANVMQCYLDEPDQTKKVVQDGWYETGDVALIDEEGFIQITGRQSRFSKIGGEMVPHIKIEEILAELIGGDEEDGLKVAVTAIPDERKGERLIVLHSKIDESPARLREGLVAAGLPNLFIPSEDSFSEIATIPVLGTGKLDLKGLKQLALDTYTVAD